MKNILKIFLCFLVLFSFTNNIFAENNSLEDLKKSFEENYKKDKNGNLVYSYEEFIIKNFDEKKLKLIDYDVFEYDGFIYLKRKKLENIDAKTFKILANGTNMEYDILYKDKNGVYYEDKKLEEIDSKTFEILNNFERNFYAKDKNNIYFSTDLNYKKIDADVKTFEILNSNIGKDKNNIFYNGEKISGIDLNSLKVLEYNTITDKNGFYLLNNEKPEKINGIDLKTLKYLGGDVYKDKNSVYKTVWSDLDKKYQIKKFEKIDKDTIVYVENKKFYVNYFKDKNNIYDHFLQKKDIDAKTFKDYGYFGVDKNGVYELSRYFEKIETIKKDFFTEKNIKILNEKNSDDLQILIFLSKTEIFKNIDLESFKAISNFDPNSTEYYSKDKNNVYFLELTEKNIGKILKGANPKTFEVLDFVYGKDDKNVYYNGEKIVGSDGKTFKYLFDNFYKDKNFVYKNGKKVNGIDANSFEKIGDNFLKDKNFAYFFDYEKGLQKINSSDGKTFEVLGRFFSKDKNNVYYKNKILNKVNPKIFEVINGHFVKYGNIIYFIKSKDGIKIDGLKKLKEIDAKSFGSLSDYHYKDKNNVYIIDGLRQEVYKMSNIDLKTFEKINGDYSLGYSKDKNGVYHYEKIIFSANPKTFEILDSYYSKDDKNVYYNDFFGKGTFIIEGADAKTFKIEQTETYNAKDKNNFYYLGKIVK